MDQEPLRRPGIPWKLRTRRRSRHCAHAQACSSGCGAGRTAQAGRNPTGFTGSWFTGLRAAPGCPTQTPRMWPRTSLDASRRREYQGKPIRNAAEGKFTIEHASGVEFR